TYKYIDRDRTWDFRPLEKLGPEAEVTYHAKDGECISSLRPQPEWFHSPTHDPQSSSCTLCARSYRQRFNQDSGRTASPGLRAKAGSHEILRRVDRLPLIV